MKTDTKKLAYGLAAFAGAMDFATGAGLVVAPMWTLGWMRVAPPGADAVIFLRWVGAFVGAVGASYLVALFRGGSLRLRETFVTTLLFRLAAGGYCAAAVAAGGLDSHWLVVAVTDLGLVATQVWLLRRGGWNDE